MIDFSIITWAFGNVSVVVVTWILMQLQVLLAYPLFIAWVSTRATASRVVDLIWLGIFLVYLSILFVFPLNEILNNDLPPVSRVIITMEQVKCSIFLPDGVRVQLWTITTIAVTTSTTTTAIVVTTVITITPPSP